ncbi:oligoribonuclease [Acrasis kona]|uniref:Oligoribonuclease n=1 Tax=Acrasis kona TaxID=1008807 RepID=A0AAW2ZP81_9EUKA
MYRGCVRIGEILSPFKIKKIDPMAQIVSNEMSKMLGNSVPQLKSSVKQPLIDERYFKMAAENPYISSNIKSGINSNAVNLTGSDNIAWVDCEMSGLDPNHHKILEICMVITDSNLNLIAEHETITIHQNEEVISEFNDWCKKQHQESGLTDRVRQSSYTNEQAELDLLQFARRFCAPKRTCLAGNTVYMDKMFLQTCMPNLNDYFHYRVIDVSSISELSKRWRSDLHRKSPNKSNQHRARIDIYESIRELMYYKENFFK